MNFFRTELFSFVFEPSPEIAGYIGLFTLLSILVTSCLLLSLLFFVLPCILSRLAYKHVLAPLGRLVHRAFYRLFPQGLVKPLVPRAYDQRTLEWVMRLQERTAAFNRRGVRASQQQEVQSPQSEESVLDTLARREEDYAEKRVRFLQQRERGELVYS